MLDFPVIINSDQLHSLITHYTKYNRKIAYQWWIKDVQNSESGDALPSPQEDQSQTYGPSQRSSGRTILVFAPR
jgi:hypothetical protein